MYIISKNFWLFLLCRIKIPVVQSSPANEACRHRQAHGNQAFSTPISQHFPLNLDAFLGQTSTKFMTGSSYLSIQKPSNVMNLVKICIKKFTHSLPGPISKLTPSLKPKGKHSSYVDGLISSFTCFRCRATKEFFSARCFSCISQFEIKSACHFYIHVLAIGFYLNLFISRYLFHLNASNQT